MSSLSKKPRITQGAAQAMPEYQEGVTARAEGKNPIQCPYAIFNVKPTLFSTVWREKFEHRFDAWMYGFNRQQWYEEALKELPDGTSLDASVHTTVEDLCYVCLHELDLVAEGEYWHPMALRRKYLKFCQKYGTDLPMGKSTYADEALQMFNAGQANRNKSHAA